MEDQKFTGIRFQVQRIYLQRSIETIKLYSCMRLLIKVANMC
jgi:hypothetical protein